MGRLVLPIFSIVMSRYMCDLRTIVTIPFLPRISASYFIMALLATIGTLQLVAARKRLVGLSLVPGRWSRQGGYILGAFLIVAPAAWFWRVEQWTIFVPGLAGGELGPLMIAAASLGLILVLTLASVLQQPWTGPLRTPLGGKKVPLKQGEGILYLGGERAGPRPAICLLVSPWENTLLPFAKLTEALLSHGFAVLFLRPRLEAHPCYPSILEVLPEAISYLSGRKELDRQRIGVLGFGLGGDLALRGAASNTRVRAVAALSPLLGRELSNSGLEALREFTLPQAIRFRLMRGQEALSQKLSAGDALAELDSRPVLLVVSAANPPPGDQMGHRRNIQRAEGIGHYRIPSCPEVVSLVEAWFYRELGG